MYNERTKAEWFEDKFILKVEKNRQTANELVMLFKNKGFPLKKNTLPGKSPSKYFKFARNAHKSELCTDILTPLSVLLRARVHFWW